MINVFCSIKFALACASDALLSFTKSVANGCNGSAVLPAHASVSDLIASSNSSSLCSGLYLFIDSCSACLAPAAYAGSLSKS